MRTETPPAGRRRSRPSFIEAARRAQIIDAAVATVNEVGFAQASLARIAQQAGISKSVVSYHFDGKVELLEQVVAQVFTEAGEAVLAAVEQEPTWSGKLGAYVRSELAFIRDNRARMLAASEILISHRGPDGISMYLRSGADDTALLESILAGGHAAEEFDQFDPAVAAITITHAIDGALTESQKDLSTDLDDYADRLIPLVLRIVGWKDAG